MLAIVLLMKLLKACLVSSARTSNVRFRIGGSPATWLNAPDSALNLAVLRIVLVTVILYWSTSGAHPAWFAGLPHALLAPPQGADWLAAR